MLGYGCLIVMSSPRPILKESPSFWCVLCGNTTLLFYGDLFMHEVRDYSLAPVYKTDFGLLTLIWYFQALQHLLMLPRVSTLRLSGLQSWQNVLNAAGLEHKGHKGFTPRHCSRFRERGQHKRSCADNESNRERLHTLTNCFQLINGAEVRSGCVWMCERADRGRLWVQLHKGQ